MRPASGITQFSSDRFSNLESFAALIVGLVGSPALPFLFRMVTLVAVFVGIVLVVRCDRRRMGMFINGYRAGRTRWITFPLLAVVLALHMLSLWLVMERHVDWAPIPLAVLAGVLAYAGSVWWCRVFRREMLGQGA